MSSLSIFANFRINNEERFLRMKDSFLSFRDLGAEKWIINIRGSYSIEAMQFLRDNLGFKLIPFQLDGSEGWLHDSRLMESAINSDFILNWIEDHINLLQETSIYKDLFHEMNVNKVDYMCYSFFAIHQKYSLISKTKTELLEFFDPNLENYNLFQE